MAEYIRRVEAIKYTGDNYDEVKEFLGDAFYGSGIAFNDEGIPSVVTPGDYIVKRENGDFFKPCSEFFEEGYELCNHLKDQ